MNTALLRTTNQGELMLSGTLDFTSTTLLWQQSKILLNSASNPIRINLSEVTQSDSSGVALLVTWQRFAHECQKEIHFLHMPAAMQAIIKTSELEKVLSII